MRIRWKLELELIDPDVPPTFPMTVATDSCDGEIDIKVAGLSLTDLGLPLFGQLQDKLSEMLRGMANSQRQRERRAQRDEDTDPATLISRLTDDKNDIQEALGQRVSDEQRTSLRRELQEVQARIRKARERQSRG